MPELMDITRRDFLLILGILAAGSAAGCSPLARYLPGENPGLFSSESPSERDWLILNRLTFGPRPSEKQQLVEIGLKNFVEEQLHPADLTDKKSDLLLSHFDVLDLNADALRNRADKLFDNYDENLVLDDFRQATLLRQVYSRRQLQEIMVEFWTDHFNISIKKGNCWFLKIVDDRDVIRKHALGNFRNLLGASAHSPAMLVYLDNQENHKDSPNENYARELLELHSLGVNGGYTQDDVMSLARCLTGWRVKEHFWRGEITFKEDAHTEGPKHILGKTISPSGKGEIDQVLDLLVKHPATAITISHKLAQRFLSDDPPAYLVSQAAEVFLKTGGDIQAVLRVILLEGLPEIFKSRTPLKYKRPLNFLISALRQTGADTDGGPAMQAYLKRMGQPLYEWPTPDGYPDTAAAWQGNLLPRWHFALDLVQNQIKGTHFDLKSSLQDAPGENPFSFLERISKNLLGGSLPSSTQAELLTHLDQTFQENPRQAAEVSIASMLASPSFQWR